jgi:DNA invertase Pin-like site-specific DNA recombinase
MHDVLQLIPAAEYLRMSLDDQQYSIPNQSVVIRTFAAEHGFQIVATYSDPGKSGVGIRHRPGLMMLLRDVLSGHAPYKTILVYDVSRWGRFQDVDEAAHYEYLCKQAGIPVLYCAEQFANDNSMSSAMMKALKRTMAAEYSRELGVKVYAGEKRLILMGYRMGGNAVFGLRRMMISSDGHRKRILRRGERKGVKSDRTILIPGPKKEIECVRRIFDLAAIGKTPPQIANEMRRGSVKGPKGHEWDKLSVYRILRNEAYIGCNVWGRTRKKLNCGTVKLPPELWIRKPGAFAPIIDVDVFNRAQKQIARRKTYPAKPDEFLLERMRRVLAKHGRLTQRLLKTHVSFDYRTYCKRFGSVLRAYELVGYKASIRAIKSGERQKKIRRLKIDLLQKLKELFPQRVRVIQEPVRNQRRFIEIDGHLNIAVQVGCPSRCLIGGQPRWLLKVHPLERGMPTLVCTSNRELDGLIDFYLVPQFGQGMRKYRILGRDSRWLRFSKKLSDLSEFCDVAIEIAGSASEKSIKMRRFGDTVISEHTRTISIAKKDVSLGPIEHAIFSLLVLNSGKVVSREKLCHALPDKEIPYLTANLCWLRRKLGKFGRRIQTVINVGYVYTPGDMPSLTESVGTFVELRPD